MQNALKTLKLLIGYIMIGIGLVILVPITLVCWILVGPFIYWDEQRKKRKFAANLLTLEGKNFFCYNNRKKSRLFIEESIRPQLAQYVECIYLEGREPVSAYDPIIVSQLLYSVKNYSKFPHLIKIRNGELIEHSINNQLFNTLEQKKPIESLLKEIDGFFES